MLWDLRRQSGGRAHSNAFPAAAALSLDLLIVRKGGNDPVEASIGKAEDILAQALTADPDAAPAKHALARIFAEGRIAVVSAGLMDDAA